MIATPIDTGSAARPNQSRLSTQSRSRVVVVPDGAKTTARITLTIVTAAPLASHFNCRRRSPEERRQLRT
jgi:hypothetical protein